VGKSLAHLVGRINQGN